MPHSIWLLILIAATTSYALRIIPFLAIKIIDISGDSMVMRFFNYASYGIIGSIVYAIAFNNYSFDDLIRHFDVSYAIRLASIFLAFFISFFVKNLLLAFAITLSIYIFLNLLLIW